MLDWDAWCGVNTAYVDGEVLTEVRDTYTVAIKVISTTWWLHENAFYITGPMWGKSTCHRWIFLT